jgi:hypothetical protein
MIISNLGKDVVIICMDEAHFTIDTDRRKCWARKGTTPIVYMNGSKEAINEGGALTKMAWKVSLPRNESSD